MTADRGPGDESRYGLSEAELRAVMRELDAPRRLTTPAGLFLAILGAAVITAFVGLMCLWAAGVI